MIELAHTVAHPGTVVIHTQNALAADRTVVHPSFLDYIALEAVGGLVQGLYLVVVDHPSLLVLAAYFFLLGFLAGVGLEFFDFFAVVDVGGVVGGARLHGGSPEVADAQDGDNEEEDGDEEGEEEGILGRRASTCLDKLVAKR